MFKASIQRQVRLGNVARQFSTVSLMRNLRSEPLAILRQVPVQPALRRLAPRYAFSHLYSTESATAQANREGEFAPVPSAPVSRFADLSQLGVNPRLVEALTRGMGYDAMTEVQSMAINPALKGTDMVAQAKTGTGKTLAFLIPIFQRVLADQPELADRQVKRRASSQDIRAIILSPTRELAEQIGVEARKLANNTGIVVQTAVGGTRKREALIKMWREGCDILVATPGRLNDLLSDQQARVAAPNLQAFVLDEADRMLDVGFSDEIRSIQDMLPSRSEKERQTLLFSATIPRDVVHLAKSMVRPDNFEFIQTIKADDSPTHERVPQHLITVKGFENIFPTILEIAQKANAAQGSGLPFKAIVFFSNTASVQFAYETFRNTQAFSRRSGIKIFEIHSKLTQGQRTRSADFFRQAESAVLFSSDVTARGMDFPNVTDVIQVGLPPDREQYIHRVGRTGRAGNSGKGWLILSHEEVPEARNRLPGLPIKPNDTIESAKHTLGDSASEDMPPLFSEVSKAYSFVPKSMFRATYLACLGQKFGRHFQAEDLVKLLNDWCLGAMGWTEPPAVSPKVAQNRGLTRMRGVRIGFDQEEEEPVRRAFGDRFGSDFKRGNDFGGRGRNDNFGGHGRNGNFGGHGRNDNFGGRGRSDNFGGRGRSDNFGGRGRNDNFRGRGHGRGRSNQNSFEDRFSSRVDGKSHYTPRASF
ncbi:DEAD-domain-containing protein [Xylaria digitata]|nr:DEAD-domain-containing protein [Xylaria digitata]